MAAISAAVSDCPEPAEGRRPLSPRASLHFVNKLLQHQLGVAQQHIFQAVLAVEVAVVHRGLNDRLAHRHGGRRQGLVEAGADAEHQVGPAKELADGAGAGVAAGPQRQRVVLGEAALAEGGGHYRRVEQFRQLHQFRRGLGVQHALSGVDDRAGGVHQAAGHPRGVHGVGGGAALGDGGVEEVGLVNLAVHHVGGGFQHHRAGRAGA